MIEQNKSVVHQIREMNSRREFLLTIHFILVYAAAFQEIGNVSIIYDTKKGEAAEAPELFAIKKLSDDTDKPFEYKYYIGQREEGN